ncbi:hypothetical protein, partial [Yersinia bercovieri]|uniref:hypothetical protein n=1 Tax=Yersinia bercovieri TaxID=634 RepID=UPI0021BD7C21
MSRLFRLSSCSLAITLALSPLATASHAAESKNDTLVITADRPITDSFNAAGIITTIDDSLP